MHFKIVNLRLQLHLPGTSELTHGDMNKIADILQTACHLIFCFLVFLVIIGLYSSFFLHPPSLLSLVAPEVKPDEPPTWALSKFLKEISQNKAANKNNRGKGSVFYAVLSDYNPHYQLFETKVEYAVCVCVYLWI